MTTTLVTMTTKLATTTTILVTMETALVTNYRYVCRDYHLPIKISYYSNYQPVSSHHGNHHISLDYSYTMTTQ